MEKKLRKMKKAAAVTLAVAMSLISAGMAALAEDAPVKAADDRVLSEEVKSQLKAAADEFPEKLDLRDYDKDGDGKGENYVTPVKAQHPFGTCWAHGTIAAAEISYLFENDLGTPAGTPNNNIDLSEKDFAWYYYHGITADDIRTDLLPGLTCSPRRRPARDLTIRKRTRRTGTAAITRGARLITVQSSLCPARDLCMNWIRLKDGPRINPARRMIILMSTRGCMAGRSWIRMSLTRRRKPGKNIITASFQHIPERNWKRWSAGWDTRMTWIWIHG